MLQRAMGRLGLGVLCIYSGLFAESVGSPGALDFIANENFAFTTIGESNWLLLRKGLQLRDRFSGPEEMEDRAMPWSVYVGPVGSLGHVHTKGSQVGYAYSSLGALGGFDVVLSDLEDRCYHMGFGAFLDYRREIGTLHQHRGSFNDEKIYASLYATAVLKSIPELAFDGIVGYAYLWDELKRRTGLSQELIAVSHPKEQIFDLLIDMEYTVSKNKYSWMPQHLSVIPLLDIQYIDDQINRYTEHGSGDFDARVRSHPLQSLTTLLGGRVHYLFATPQFQLLTEIDGGWQREYLKQHREISFTFFQISNTPSHVQSMGAGYNSWLLGVDLLATIGRAFQMEVSCDLKWNRLFFDTSLYFGIGGEF